MKPIQIVSFGMALLFLTSCGIAVPEKYKSITGKWMGSKMTMVITSEGEVQTLKMTTESNVAGTLGEEVNGPLREIDDNHFVIGPGSFSVQEFKINRLPWEEDGVWYFEVDGNVMKKME